MGFFKRISGPASQSSSAQEQKVEPGLTPVECTDADLTMIGSLLTGYEQALGRGEANLASALLDIAKAGGFTDVLDMTMAIGNEPDIINRPWRWLTAVSNETYAREDWLTTARIGTFVQIFSTRIFPSMNQGVQMDTGIYKAPDDVISALLGNSVLAMSHLDPKQNIVSRDDDPLPMEAARLTQAVRLLELDKAGKPVAPEAREYASSLVDALTTAT